MEALSLEQVQVRHRRELKDLQGRITNKKKNSTKKTRKGVNDECAQMERELREKQAAEIASLTGESASEALAAVDDEREAVQDETSETSRLKQVESKIEEKLEKAAEKLQLGSGGDLKQEDQHGTGKKRNRQKERLARRAEEQEAAAQQAEEEAAGMTDNRARESEYMKKMFSTYDLVEKDIEPDGHCLFSAVADQLSQNAIPLGGTAVSSSGNEQPYKIVRGAAAAFMAENPDDFSPFLEEDFDSYVTRIRDTAEWGGQLELTALARRYGAEIRVVQDGRMEKIGEEEGKVTGKTLWLAYYRHGYGLGEHYNSLRKTTKV